MQREAAEITEQAMVTGSEGTGEGVSHAAAVDADAASEVEPAGHFRIYLGAAPGVGKTYAMLSEGHRRRSRGTDVVIGFVEAYGRPLTEALINGLEVVPRRGVDYRGSRLEGMDLDAILRRRPEVALVDELAHTDAPGSGRHDKRWQDVLEILGAGIDVITTVNIQHLESIADEVEQMTGAKVRERVPDWVVRKADQIELVDSSPEQLRRRMLHGNIYPMEKVPQALTHFFRTDNLIALRELALRFVADESDEELLEHLRRHQPQVLWETCERIMAAVTAAPGNEVLMRRAARIASRENGELDVVHVIAGDPSLVGDGRSIDGLRQLAADLGARWHEIEDDDPARAIVSFARENQITQIVIGSIQHSWWHIPPAGRSYDALSRRPARPASTSTSSPVANRPAPRPRVPPRSPELAQPTCPPARRPRSRCPSSVQSVKDEQQRGEASEQHAGRGNTGASLAPFLDLTVRDEPSENGEQRYDGHQPDHQGGDGQPVHRTGWGRRLIAGDQGAERARRQVGGYGGKLGIGSCAEGLPDPLLAFVLGQPAFGKGRLENVDYAFPVRCRGSHVAVFATKPSMTWFRQHRFLQHRVPAIPGSRLRRAGQIRGGPKYAYTRIISGFPHGEPERRGG